MRALTLSHICLATVMVLGGIVSGAPASILGSKGDTTAGLINATPYHWRRGYINGYQVHDWTVWPEYINPGESASVRVRSHGGSIGADSAAEVRYHLEGTSEPMALQVEYRKGDSHHVWVRFMESLRTLNNAPKTEHDLGFLNSPGGVGFVLAGTEGHFLSNDPPLNWMKATLPGIGHLPLRELAMPRSHHAGMWKAVAPIGAGVPSNTLTQNDGLWDQIRNGGIRVLDIRATRWHDHFRESHASKVGILGWQGMFGAGVEEMIDIVNEFNREVPGELFIWDIHMVARSADRHWQPLNDWETNELYQLLKKLEHRVVIPDNEDITWWPLERLIGRGKSAVIVRISSSWLLDHPKVKFPGGREGFATDRNFPLHDHWSAKNNVGSMVDDEIGAMASNRTRRDMAVFDMQWIITQDAGQIFMPVKSIMVLNEPAWRTLYREFWDALTDESYPNWLTMDGMHGNQIKAMCMAINKCLAARRCGTLGGKVKLLGKEGQGG